MPRVIINADDFGITDGVTCGIVDAIQQGVVTSTTAMACVPGAAERLRYWAPKIPRRIGAHLQLTTGRPLSHPSLIPTLCGPDGNFHPSKSTLANASIREILYEWQLQYQFLLDLGIQPTHIDTHHHVHKLPNVFEAYCEMAMRRAIPARAVTPAMRLSLRQASISCPDHMVLDFYGDNLNVNSLLALAINMTALKNEVVEIMCHPGYSCHTLPALSKYIHQRDQEMAVLCSPQLKERLSTYGIALCSYEALSYMPGSTDISTNCG